MMDPDEVLKQIREQIERYFADASDYDEAELLHSMHNLDEWLSKDGFLPSAWARDHVTVKGVKVTTYNSVVNPGAVSVQVETEDTEPGQRVRVMLNDGDLFAGDPEVDS